MDKLFGWEYKKSNLNNFLKKAQNNSHTFLNLEIQNNPRTFLNLRQPYLLSH